MSRTAVFIDHENQTSTKECLYNHEGLMQHLRSQGCEVIHAESLLAVDALAESNLPYLHEAMVDYRSSIKESGYVLNKKTVKRIKTKSCTVLKANVDVDLTISALMNSDQAEIIVLVTGDGDFCPLVEELQRRGKQVIGISSSSYSQDLKHVCDLYYSKDSHQDLVSSFIVEKGYPELISKYQSTMAPVTSEDTIVGGLTENGKIQFFDKTKGFGFILTDSGTNTGKRYFFHISEVQNANGGQPTNEEVYNYFQDFYPVSFTTCTLCDDKISAKGIKLIVR